MKALPLVLGFDKDIFIDEALACERGIEIERFLADRIAAPGALQHRRAQDGEESFDVDIAVGSGLQHGSEQWLLRDGVDFRAGRQQLRRRYLAPLPGHPPDRCADCRMRLQDECAEWRQQGRPDPGLLKRAAKQIAQRRIGTKLLCGQKALRECDLQVRGLGACEGLRQQRQRLMGAAPAHHHGGELLHGLRIIGLNLERAAQALLRLIESVLAVAHHADIEMQHRKVRLQRHRALPDCSGILGAPHCEQHPAEVVH